MYRNCCLATMLAPALLVLSLAGCGSKPAAQESKGQKEESAHAHATQGPHGGSLIELGNEEYHAELVHDEKAGKVTVYVLDSAAKAAIPIEATEIVINLKHEGKGEQFKLAASPDAGEPAGKSSRFVSQDAELAADLDREGADAQLAVTINGKPFRGAVAHEHK